MSSDHKNLILPITTSPDQSTIITINDKEEVGCHRQSIQKPSHRQRLLRYGRCCTPILAIITVAILVVSFTVFKVREPTMKLNSISLGEIDLTKNVSVMADVSVKNPNTLAFKFSSSKTSLLYGSREVGLAYGPPGTVGAHRTLRTNVTVDVITDRLLSDSAFMVNMASGSLELETSTMVWGKVTILGMFKRHVDVMMNCTVSVSIASQAILDQHCTQRMWL